MIIDDDRLRRLELAVALLLARDLKPPRRLYKLECDSTFVGDEDADIARLLTKRHGRTAPLEEHPAPRVREMAALQPSTHRRFTCAPQRDVQLAQLVLELFPDLENGLVHEVAAAEVHLK